MTATGEDPVGWQADEYPRAEMDAVFGPKLWEQLGLNPPTEERPLASMFVFYRDTVAESIDINLRHCDQSKLACASDFAQIVWDR